MPFSVETYKRCWAHVAWSWFGILLLGLLWVVWKGDGPGFMAVYNFPWVKPTGRPFTGLPIGVSLRFISCSLDY